MASNTSRPIELLRWAVVLGVSALLGWWIADRIVAEEEAPDPATILEVRVWPVSRDVGGVALEAASRAWTGVPPALERMVAAAKRATPTSSPDGLYVELHAGPRTRVVNLTRAREALMTVPGLPGAPSVVYVIGGLRAQGLRPPEPEDAPMIRGPSVTLTLHRVRDEEFDLEIASYGSPGPARWATCRLDADGSTDCERFDEFIPRYAYPAIVAVPATATELRCRSLMPILDVLLQRDAGAIEVVLAPP